MQVNDEIIKALRALDIVRPRIANDPDGIQADALEKAVHKTVRALAGRQVASKNRKRKNARKVVNG